MINELLKIITEADDALAQYDSLYNGDHLQLLAAGLEDLKGIDEQINQHFQDYSGI